MKTIKIGQFGFGCVGEGLFDIVTDQKKNLPIAYQKICIRDINKSRKAPLEILTDNPKDLFEDVEINLIVELINDADHAFKIVSTAIRKGIPVVSANKKMIAIYYGEIQKLIAEYKTPFLYEGAVCGAIPILQTLENYYQFDKISKVEGIFNGTTNYILTKQFEEKIPFNLALKDAQAKGFAEVDPTSDIDGLDPKYKLKILLAHSFGLDVPVDQIFATGIRNISQNDISYAKNKGLKYRLISKIIKHENQVCALVCPILVKESDLAYKIDHENNYVSITAEYTGKQLLYGKGAGSHPTGIAVFSDITGVINGLSYTKSIDSNLSFTNEVFIEILISAQNLKLLDNVKFNEAYQVYESQGYFYKTGKVSINSLLSTVTDDLFIGLINNKVEFEKGEELLLV